MIEPPASPTPMVPDETVFITFCRRCHRATRFPIGSTPQNAKELEDLRARIARVCPDHGETTDAEAKQALGEGKFDIPAPVAHELAEYYRRNPRWAS